MVKCNTLATYGHILSRITLSIGDDLIVIGVIDTVEVEEIFYHFWKVIVELKDVVRFQVIPNSIFCLFYKGFSFL